jgi:PAS domain S-box-containing protein
LVELSFETVAIHANGRILDMNQAGLTLFGADRPDELVGKPIMAFVHPDFVDVVTSRVEQQSSGKGSGVPLLEEKFLRLDGTAIDVETAAVPIQYNGKPAIQTVIRDISARKQAELEREQLLATEREQRVLAETLGEVFLSLAAQTRSDTVLDEILLQAQRIVSYNAANIVLLRDDTLYVAHHKGYSQFNSREQMSTLTQSLLDLPLDAEVVTTRRPVVIPDTGRNSQWVVSPDQEWIRSFIAVPISLGERVLGLLRLDCVKAGRFTEEDVQRLLPLAHAAAIALENARLHEQARREIDERTQAETALRKTAAKNQAILDAISDSIFYVNSDGTLLDYKLQDGSHTEWAWGLEQNKKTIAEIFPAELSDLLFSHLTLALETGKIQLFEYEQNTNANLSHFEFRLVATGKNEVLAIISDITELKAHHAALEKERSRIARDLHDSLGQSLGYLRLKLDEFSMEEMPYTLAQIRPQLGQMRDVANEVYEMVRSMLAAARPSNSNALNAVLQAQARSMGNRARFKVEFSSTGKPHTLPPIVQQQVLFICQETLNNVEKHAEATNVKIELFWNAEGLDIAIADDGLGFDTDVAVESGHYGLTIMQERVAEINGRLSVVSALQQGTIIKLHVPVSRTETVLVL